MRIGSSIDPSARVNCRFAVALWVAICIADVSIKGDASASEQSGRMAAGTVPNGWQRPQLGSLRIESTQAIGGRRVARGPVRDRADAARGDAEHPARTAVLDDDDALLRAELQRAHEAQRLVFAAAGARLQARAQQAQKDP